MGLAPAKDPVGSEDCLYLNVWQPAGADNLPVMVWIHGGGFVLGSGGQDLYEATELAGRGDVIVVTINYRLGPFGFLAHPALADENGNTGNYGIMDQVAALEWVRDNVAAFGGDTGNVTIFGQSAGGMSVSLLTLSPATNGLFQKAVIQSGSAAVLKKTDEQENANGLIAAERLGCTDKDAAAACLRGVDAVTMMQTLRPTIGLMSDAELTEGFPFHPVIDGAMIPDMPVKLLLNGEYDKSLKIMMGTTKDEATIFLFQKKVDTEDDFYKTFESDMKMVKASFGIDVQDDKILEYYPLDKYASPKDAYSDLFTDLAFTCPTREHASILADNDGEVYLYHFLRVPSKMGLFKDMGSFHSAELFFLFGNWKFMGFVAQLAGKTCYFSGDTLLHAGLTDLLQPFTPDVAFLPINGNKPERRVAGNLNGEEAAALAREIGAKLVVPHHFDMFEFNTADPAIFEAACEQQGQACRTLRNGEGIGI